VSNAAGTARVADITNGGANHDNKFNGTVEVERYINVGPAADQHGQAWEFLATPTRGQTIKESWMEGGSYASTWYGTQITGPGGTGFDRYSLYPSMKYYVPGSSPFNLSSPDWKGISGTNIPIYDSSGYMLYVWGDRSISNGTSKANTVNTRMRTKGDLLTYQVTTPAAANMFTSIGNPYASAIDMTKVNKTGGVDEFFSVWQSPTFGTYGFGTWVTYELDPSDGSYHSTPGGFKNNDIQSGQAFIVQTTGGAGTLVFNESSKTGGSSNAVFRGMSIRPAQLRTNLYQTTSGGSAKLLDGTLTQYNEQYSNKIDGRDARKMFNSSENLSIRSDGKDLIIERRRPIEKTDTIFYRFINQGLKKYRFELIGQDLAESAAEGYLIDKYMKTRTALNMDGVTTYDFSVENDSASKDPGRFYVVFKAAVTLPFTITSVNAKPDNGNIVVNWQVANETNMKEYEVEKSVDGLNFISASKVAATNTGYSTYGWTDAKVLPGVYYYRVRCISVDGKIEYSNSVKVLIGDGKSSITIYPNPITNGIINLHFNNLPAGKYGIRLMNQLGQTIFKKQIERMYGSSIENIQWNYHLAHGIYRLEVIKPDGTVKEIKVMY
jgi:hypothetical protein